VLAAALAALSPGCHCGNGGGGPEAEADVLDDAGDRALDDGAAESRDGVDEAATPEAVDVDAETEGDAPPEASPSCLHDGPAEGAAVAIAPPHPRPARAVEFDVTSETGYTNVTLRLCGPAGIVTPDGPTTYPGSPNLWVWSSPGLDRGAYQAQFAADPGGRVYGVAAFIVDDDPRDVDGDGYAGAASGGDDCNDAAPDIHPGAVDACGDGIDSDCSGGDAACDLCGSPAGNLLAHGEFEEGMAGPAPAGWEVRSPGMPESCPGVPESHVYVDSAAPGCAGRSLVIDAGGTWDCYAIQTVSGYGTIEAGRTYRISAAVRSEGNAVNPAAWFLVGVQWVDAGDRFFGDDKNPRTARAEDNDFDWKLLAFDLVAPAGATRILVWLTAHYPGRVHYDNVSVVRID
jgi:hypothetical protein